MNKKAASDSQTLRDIEHHYRRKQVSPFELGTMEAAIRRKVREPGASPYRFLRPTLAALACLAMLTLGTLVSIEKNEIPGDHRVATDSTQRLFFMDTVNLQEDELDLPEDYMTLSQLIFIH